MIFLSDTSLVSFAELIKSWRMAMNSKLIENW